MLCSLCASLSVSNRLGLLRHTLRPFLRPPNLYLQIQGKPYRSCLIQTFLCVHQ